ncbi:hypothetical protein PTKIN_Ptkin14bG0069800 [Pterospermum kingtungense]
MDILSFSACFLLLIIFSKVSIALDMISPSESLTDGMTLVSEDGSFELGFFTPGSSKNRYLGIWYNNIPMQTVVWVANRINPIYGSAVLLKVEKMEKKNYLWQRFDYPSDTLLPGMKLGYDLRTGLNRRLSAWKSTDDPSPGDLTLGIELQGNPEMVLRKGSEKYYRTGLWVGNKFSGSPDHGSNPIHDFDLVWNEKEVYYIFFLKNKSLMSRFVLNQTENIRQRYTWNPESRTWKLFSTLPNNFCDRFGQCGPNGSCDDNKLPACQCFKGFRPKSAEEWNSSDWVQGCVHTKPLNCRSGVAFIKIAKVTGYPKFLGQQNNESQGMQC